MPIVQWLYFDSLEALPESGVPAAADLQPVSFNDQTTPLFELFF